MQRVVGPGATTSYSSSVPQQQRHTFAGFLQPSLSQHQLVLIASSRRAASSARFAQSCSRLRSSSRQPQSARRSKFECTAVSEPPAELSSVTPCGNAYRRVLLKISGEALQGGVSLGVDPKVLHAVAKEVATAAQQGIQIAIVVGGGNYFRGADAWRKIEGLDRVTADHVGMLATCMNAIMMQSVLESLGTPTRVQTAIEMREIAEPWVRRRAVRHLEKGRVVIFGAGTGNPFFSTDTAAALRAAEIDAQAFFKATKVDGVYDCDPVTNPDAKLHRRLTFKEVTSGNLKVMDETAITLCKENDIPVVVFNLVTPGNIVRALTGDASVGTLVSKAMDSDLPTSSQNGASQPASQVVS